MQRETTQSKYRLVEKPQTDANNIQDNEVRITTRGRVSNYVQYSLNLLEGTPQGQTRNQQNNTASSDNQQGQQPAQSTQASQPDQQAQTQKQTGAQETKPAKKFDTIVLKATGGAITGAVNTAEVVKRRVAGLHQLTKLETLEIEDHWEPTEEGLKPVKTTRRVASISITLTRDLKSIDEKDVGYQEPLPIEAVLNPPRGIGRGFRGRGGFRGGRGRGGFRGGRGRGGFRGGPRGGRGGFRGGPRGRGTGPRGRGGFRGGPRGSRGGFRGGRPRGSRGVGPRGRGGFRGNYGGFGGNYGGFGGNYDGFRGNYGGFGGNYGGFNGGFRSRGGPRGNFRSRGGGFRGGRDQI